LGWRLWITLVLVDNLWINIPKKYS
jgi:hypothetical protein